MTLRLHVDTPLSAPGPIVLPPGPARHVQVRRMQPGEALVLFDGLGGEWDARVREMGRRDVTVELGTHRSIERELAVRVTLAIGMPANERMDALVEKAAELGAAVIQPLHTARSVLRLSGERAERRRAHWQGVATAACEQSGRTRLPELAPVRELDEWLRATVSRVAQKWLLAPESAAPLAQARIGAHDLLVLSGPEGGLSPEESAQALAAGFTPWSLGPRVLRADTAPLAVLAALGVLRHAD